MARRFSGEVFLTLTINDFRVISWTAENDQILKNPKCFNDTFSITESPYTKLNELSVAQLSNIHPDFNEKTGKLPVTEYYD